MIYVAAWSGRVAGLEESRSAGNGCWETREVDEEGNELSGWTISYCEEGVTHECQMSGGEDAGAPTIDWMSIWAAGSCYSCGFASEPIEVYEAPPYDPSSEGSHEPPPYADPRTAASGFMPRLSLGQTSYGEALGSVVVTPDLTTNASLTAADVKAVFKKSLGLLETTEVSETHPTTGLTIKQFQAPDALIHIEEIAGGSLRILAFRPEDVTQDPQETLATIPNVELAITDLTATRITLEGLPGLKMTGDYLGDPYTARFARVVDEGVGAVSMTEINGRKLETVDNYEADLDDADGYARIRALAEYKLEPVTDSWVPIKYSVVRTRTLLNGREVVLQEDVTAANGELLTTTYTYDELVFVGEVLNKSYGKMTSQTNPDGSWVRYDYDTEGRLFRIYRPWLDAPATAAAATATNCLTDTMTYFDPGTPWEGEQTKETAILGTTVATVSSVFATLTSGNFTITRTETKKRLNASGNVESYSLTSVKEYLITEDERSRLVKTTAANGMVTEYAELRGDLDVNGAFTVDAEGAVTAKLTWGPLDSSGNTIAGQTQRRVSYQDGAGLMLREVRSFATSAAAPGSATYADYDGVIYAYDSEGQLEEKRRLDGTVEESIVRAPLLDPQTSEEVGSTETVTDGHGTPKILTYDLEGNLIGTTYQGVSVTVAGATTTLQDQIERTITTAGDLGTIAITRTRSGPTSAVASVTLKDAAQRTLITIDEQSRKTTFTYDNVNRTQTTTAPGGITRISARYLDGRPKSLTGTGVVAEYYTVALNTDGTVNETTHVGTASSPRWRTVIKTHEGTVLKEMRPNPANPSQSVTTQYLHDDYGRVVKVKRPGLADSITQYDAVGQVMAQGYDLSGNGALERTGIDVMTEKSGYLEVNSGQVWQVTTERTLTQAVADPNPTSILKTVRRRMNLGSAGLVITTESNGTTTVTTTPNRSTGITVVTTVGTGTGQSVTQYFLRGVPVAEQRGLTKVIRLSYDFLGRLAGRTGYAPDNSDSETYVYDPNGSVSTVRGGQATAVYLPYGSEEANAGRLWKIIAAGGGGTTIIEYNARGQETLRSGDGTYKQERTYTAYGEPETLKTWRTAQGQPDVTTWGYQEATGLLISKTDAASEAVSYTHDSAGRTRTRTWARGVVTTYGYDGAGRVLTQDYSDTTPDVRLTRDRAGRVAEATDASGTRALSYETMLPQGQESKAVWSAASLLPNWEFRRTRSTWKVVEGTEVRASGSLSYSYHLLSTVSLAGVSATYDWSVQWQGAQPNGVSYSGAGGLMGTRAVVGNYQEVQWTSNDVGAMTTWGASRNSRGQVTNTYLNIREDGANSQETAVSYNLRGEVIGTLRADQDHVPTGLLPPGGARRFTYDGMGNRTSTSVSVLGEEYEDAQLNMEDRETTTYAPNGLNQYTTIGRDNPLLQLIQGAAAESSTVEVSVFDSTGSQSLTVARVGLGNEGFVSQVAVDVSAGPAWRKVRVKAGEPGPVREGWLYFPPQTETLSYDDDGNLISDARWNYGWDAENRLVVMEEKALEGGGPGRKRLEFTYDHQSRRVRKLVKTWQDNLGAAGGWRVTKDVRFVYDGWNMVAELDATPEVMSGAVKPRVWRSYAWGIDLSGTEQGAGGVGGLLLVHEQKPALGNEPASSRTYAPCYDHNGNVLAYVDCATGSVTQRFEYDAFGRESSISSMLISGTSTSQEAPPMRFSTKYVDEETRLSYYGYRYYSAEMGRWLNRDPIGEKGGVNLYGMVGNDAVNRWDILGLFEFCLPKCYHTGAYSFGTETHPSERVANFMQVSTGESTSFDDINKYKVCRCEKKCQKAGGGFNTSWEFQFEVLDTTGRPGKTGSSGINILVQALRDVYDQIKDLEEAEANCQSRCDQMMRDELGGVG